MSATLDTEHLRTFIAVTETGSFTRAARRRHLSQSTISAHVAALERLLGVGLLDRRPDGTEVSEAGEEFLHRAVALVALTDETLERFRGADDAEPTWGMTDFVVNEFPPHAVAEIAQAVAARRFRLLLGKSHELESGAASGGVDAILTLTFEPPTGAVLIGSVPLVWLESSSRPIYREPASAVPLVLKPETSPLRQRAVAVLASTGRTARIAVEATGVDAMLASCRLGLGYAALPLLGAPPEGLRVVTGMPELGDAGLWFRAGPRLPSAEASEMEAMARRAFDLAAREARGHRQFS